ncbi:MAG TPA: hypothetical protein VF521_00875, partial [Pyrinomonadaceae bacterium]
MKRKRLLTAALSLVAALTLAHAASAQAPAPADDAERERAKALWEEAVRAKGGRERLRSIKSLLISSTVYARAPRGSNTKDAVRLYAMPGKVWAYTYTEEFDVKIDATVVNAGRKLCTVTLAPESYGVRPLSICLAETWTQYLIQDPFIYLLETEWVRPSPLRARTEGKLDVVETEVGKLRADFYLHRKTRLPVRIVTEWQGGIGRATGSLGPMEVLLEDYAEVEGVRMPRRVTRRLLNSERASVGDPPSGDEERARYRFNVAYDPTIF